MKHAHGITHTRPIYANGSHFNCANEPTAFTEAELQAGDLERLQRQKQHDADRVRIAHEADLQKLRNLGFL